MAEHGRDRPRLFQRQLGGGPDGRRAAVAVGVVDRGGDRKMDPSVAAKCV